MRAIGVTEFGGPDALTVLDVPEPHAGAGEIAIRVHAATVNPTDTGLRSGAYGDRMGDQEPPYIPGMDAAGVVDEVGEGVDRLSVGDEVMALVLPAGPHKGAYADRIVLPAESAVAIPDGADFVAASTLPMNGMTARITLDAFALPEGSTIAVTGAAGSYGGYVVQLAKAHGLRVIADASEADEQLVRDLGADIVVRRGDDVADRIREVVPGGVDALADGAIQNGLAAAAVKDGGQFATVRGWDGDAGRGITVHKIMVFGSAKETAKLEELRELASTGKVTLRVARTFPADDAVEAHKLLEAGGTRGRIVLDFS